MRVLVVAALLIGCYAPSPPSGAPCIDGVCPSGLVCSPATNTCERTPTNRDSALDDGPRDAPIDSPDANTSLFKYRRRITIQNSAATLLPTGFTIRLPLGAMLATLVTDGKVKPDFSDLHVIGDAGERDRIVDPPPGPAPVAVSFSLAQAIAANTTVSSYYLYYGGTTTSVAAANGKQVFALYDDFTTGISATWLKNDAPAVVGGKLVLRAARTDAITTVAGSDGVPIVSAVELVASVADPASEPTPQTEGTFWYWFGYQHTGDFSASAPWIIWIARAKNLVKAEQNSPVGCEANCVGGDFAQNTAPHYYAIERDPSATRFYRDGALAYTAPVTNNADYSVIVRNYMATSDLQIDWIRARARVTPEPTITLGAEEIL